MCSIVWKIHCWTTVSTHSLKVAALCNKPIKCVHFKDSKARHIFACIAGTSRHLGEWSRSESKQASTTGPRSEVGNVSGNRCESDCRSRGREFDPRSRPGPILLWKLIMKQFIRSFSSLPLKHSKRIVVSYKWKYVHKVLVNCLFKLAQEKVWLGEVTVLP